MGKAVTVHPRARIWRENGKIRIGLSELDSTDKTIRLTIGENTDDGQLLLGEIFTQRVKYLNDLYPDVTVSADPRGRLDDLVVKRSGAEKDFQLWHDGIAVRLSYGDGRSLYSAAASAEDLLATAGLLAEIIREMGWRDEPTSGDDAVLLELIRLVDAEAFGAINGATLSMGAGGDVHLVKSGTELRLVCRPHSHEQVQALRAKIGDSALWLVLDLRTEHWRGQTELMRSLTREGGNVAVVGLYESGNLMLRSRLVEISARMLADRTGRGVLLTEASEDGKALEMGSAAQRWASYVLRVIETLADQPTEYLFAADAHIETTAEKVQRLFASSQGLSPQEFAAALEREGLLKS